VIDSATKTGKANDGTGVAYYAINKANKFAPLVLLDWDLVQIAGDLLINWLPGVIKRLEVLAAQTGARSGSLGAFVEDKDSGQILLQAASRKPFAKFVHAIPSELTAIGKDERAIKASGHVYPGKVKFSLTAWEKVTTFKGSFAKPHVRAGVGVSRGRQGRGEARRRPPRLFHLRRLHRPRRRGRTLTGPGRTRTSDSAGNEK
jgi:hypothetical protein